MVYYTECSTLSKYWLQTAVNKVFNSFKNDAHSNLLSSNIMKLLNRSKAYDFCNRCMIDIKSEFDGGNVMIQDEDNVLKVDDEV